MVSQGYIVICGYPICACMLLSMVIHGYPWLSMVIHGYPWLSMSYLCMVILSVPVCCCQWLSMVIHGYLWLSMVINGYPWLSGYQWLSVVIHGYQWLAIVHHPWLLCCLAKYELNIVNEEGTPGRRRLLPERSLVWAAHALSGNCVSLLLLSSGTSIPRPTPIAVILPRQTHSDLRDVLCWVDTPPR